MTTDERTRLIGRLIDLYSRGEAEIARRLAGDVTEWRRSFLESRRAEIRRILDALDERTVEWASYAIPQIYRDGVVVADVVTGVGAYGSIHQSTVARIVESLTGDLRSATRTVGRRVDDVFRRVGMGSLSESMVAGENRRSAVRRMVGQFVDGGMEAYVDSSGRRWGLSRYSDMVVRTTSREAATAGTVNRLVERGRDLVQVTSHGGSCRLCGPWEGQVLSLTGSTDGRPRLDDARDSGLFHPNCAHVIVPHV